MNLLPLAIKNIKRSRQRSILSGLAIALSTLLCIFMICFIIGAMDDYNEMLVNYNTGMVQARHKDFNTYDYLNPIQYFVENETDIRKNALTLDSAVQAVSRIYIPGKLYVKGVEKGSYGLGVDFENEVMDFEGMLREGQYPERGKKEAAIGIHLAQSRGISLGDKITILTGTVSRGSNAMSFEVTALVAYPNTAMKEWFMIPLDQGQKLTGMDGGASEVLLFLEDMKQSKPSATSWNALLPENLEARAHSDLHFMYMYMKLGKFIYILMAGLFVLLGCTVIINTMMMLVYERVKEIGILTSMGFTPREIGRLFFLEAFFISLISSVIGMILGALLVAQMAQTGIHIGEMELMDTIDLDYPTVYYPVLSAKTVIISAFMAIGITSLVGLIPARRAAGMKPVEALNS